MTNREAIKMLKTILRTVYLGNRKFIEAVEKAISALEKQEQSCDTCRHKHEHFSGKRCGNCSVGYPDRYEAETNFEVTTKNFEPYTEKES